MRCKEATTFIRQTAGYNKTISGDYHPFLAQTSTIFIVKRGQFLRADFVLPQKSAGNQCVTHLPRLL